jgi:hypothetical protein
MLRLKRGPTPTRFMKVMRRVDARMCIVRDSIVDPSNVVRMLLGGENADAA